MTVSRRRACVTLLLGACALLSSCASLVGPRQVEIPLHKLQAGLERRFPLNNRMLELFDVRLTRPQLYLLPEQDRVALSISADIAPPFLRRSYTGSIDLSGRLYVDPGRGAVYMAEPQVDRFALDGVDGGAQRQLAKVANAVMDTVVRDIPVYSFRMDELRYAGVQFVPTRIRATRSGLLVSLEPLK